MRSQRPIAYDVEAVGPGSGNAEQASAERRFDIPNSFVRLCRHERQFHSCFRHVLFCCRLQPCARYYAVGSIHFDNIYKPLMDYEILRATTCNCSEQSSSALSKFTVPTARLVKGVNSDAVPLRLCSSSWQHQPRTAGPCWSQSRLAGT